MKRSFIFGGGNRGGPIFLIVLDASSTLWFAMVIYLRSGELLPWVLDNGARPGILDGLILPFDVDGL